MGKKKQADPMMDMEPTIFERLKDALEDSISFSAGQISLVTTALPAPPPRPRPADIAELRNGLRMSQAVFAAVINVSVKTLQSWEQGIRRPSCAALRLLQIIGDDPGLAQTVLQRKRPDVGVQPQPGSRRGPNQGF